ncbi:MAG: hypothetical protein M1827_005863 [Pycnora praestabilis]|nr:MAG: hypothetical protein M1827_005863 [Pycnora praestabilis]
MSVIETLEIAGSETWEASRLESALARLKEMHIQLRSLRTTIPRMIRPLTSPHSSPEELYNDFANAAGSAAKEVQAFRYYMEDEASRSVLQQADTSRKEMPDGINAWRVTDHPDWLDRDERHVEVDGKGVDVQIDAVNIEAEQDTGKILEQFREAHPTMKVNFEGDTNSITLYLPPPARIHFHVTQQPSASGKSSYLVSTKESTHLHKAILRGIETRPMPNNLSYLLELLASYTNIKSMPCIKCSKLLDTKPQFATIRRKNETSSVAGTGETSWKAYHEGCV